MVDADFHIPAHDLDLWRDDDIERREKIWQIMRANYPNVIIDSNEYLSIDHRLQNTAFEYGRMFKAYQYSRLPPTAKERAEADKYHSDAIEMLQSYIDQSDDFISGAYDTCMSEAVEKEIIQRLARLGVGRRATSDTYELFARMPEWHVKNAASLLTGLTPNAYDQLVTDGQITPNEVSTRPVLDLPQKIDNLVMLIAMNAESKGFGYRDENRETLVYPSRLIEWCDQFEIDVPDDLREAVTRFSDLPNLKEENERLQARIDELESQLESNGDAVNVNGHVTAAYKIRCAKRYVDEIIKAAERLNGDKVQSDSMFNQVNEKYLAEHPNCDETNPINQTQYKQGRKRALEKHPVDVQRKYKSGGRPKAKTR